MSRKIKQISSQPPWVSLILGALLAGGAGCSAGNDQDDNTHADDDTLPDDDTVPDDDATPGDDDATADDDTSPSDDDATDDDTSPPDDDTVPAEINPPLGGSSGGGGGGTCPGGCVESAGTVEYRIIVPSTYQDSHPACLLEVYSGTEGGQAMTQNMHSVQAYAGLSACLIAILDGSDYYGDGDAGAVVLDDVRTRWNIDNDQTWMLSESAGTSAGLELAFHLRQSWFAAVWFNDVNATDSPSQSSIELGFAPWGNAGPGGDFPDANTIVSGMEANGYQLPVDAPYSGAGSDTHGSTDQFLEAVGFFAGKSRE